MEAFFALMALSLVWPTAEAKCHFGHQLNQEYVVEQVYHLDAPLKFHYVCQSKKFQPTSPEFFYYHLQFCSANNETYKPSETWRHDAFKYECFFKVSQEEGSISEVRHVGCFVEDYFIEKGSTALIKNYRYACDDTGLHPLSCVSTKEGLEIPAENHVDYGLDTYFCNKTETGLTLQEVTNAEECKLMGDVALAYLIDTSESIKEALFDSIVKPAVAAELKQLPDNYKVRLVSYSTSWQSHTDWVTVTKETKEELAEKALSLPFIGEGTKTASALRNTAKLFDEVVAAAKFIVLITDGEAKDKEKIPEAVKDLAQKSIKVISVGIGNEINATELIQYGYIVIELEDLEGLRKALATGQVRCKLYERLRKTLDAKRYCDIWAATDVPMQLKFLPTCPTTRTAAEGAPEMTKDPACANDKDPVDATSPGWKNCQNNKGADICFLTKSLGIRYGGKDGLIFKSRNQCCYDSSGILIRDPRKGSGVAQKASNIHHHVMQDVQPAEFCREAGLEELYFLHRPSPGTASKPATVDQK